jgi:hypothetical protein
MKKKIKFQTNNFFYSKINDSILFLKKKILYEIFLQYINNSYSKPMEKSFSFAMIRIFYWIESESLRAIHCFDKIWLTINAFVESVLVIQVHEYSVRILRTYETFDYY